MSLHSRTLALASCLIATAVGSAAAQDAPLLVEAAGGLAVPLSDFRSGDGPGEGTSAGASLSVLFAVPGDGRRTLYAGFSQHRFGCEAAGCDTDGRYVGTGFDVGLRFALLREHRALPWIGIGAITTRVETDDLGASSSSAPNAGVTDLGFGAEAGFGLLVVFGGSVAWSSSVLVSGVNSTLPGGTTLELRYLTTRTGLSFLF